MATVTALCDRVCTTTGMTSTGTERTLVLAMMNQIYEESCKDAGVYIVDTGSVTLTSGTADYMMGTSPMTATGFLTFRDLWISSDGNRLLERKTERQIREARESNATTGVPPRWYAFEGTGLVMLYPTPGSDTLKFSYERTPLTLVESGPSAGVSESTPTAFQSPFHYRVLANGTTSLVYEYKRDEDAAMYYDKKYREAVEALKMHIGQSGGQLSSWIDVDDSDGIAVYPDEGP